MVRSVCCCSDAAIPIDFFTTRRLTVTPLEGVTAICVVVSYSAVAINVNPFLVVADSLSVRFDREGGGGVRW